MAQREGTVYLYLFIVAMILFVLATVGFIFKYNEADEHRAAAVRAKAEAKVIQGNLTEATVEMAKVKELIAGTGADEQYTATGELISAMQEKLKAVGEDITAARRDQNQSEISFSSLIEPYTEISDLFKGYQEQRDLAVSGQKTSSDAMAALTQTKAEEVQKLQQDLAAARDQVASVQQKLEDANSELGATATRMTTELEEIQETSTDELLVKNRVIQSLRNSIDTLTILNETLMEERLEKEDFEDADPDGQLYQVSTDVGKVWVNLGRKNHLQKGLVFNVFQPIKGGKKQLKGRVEVSKVHESYAECTIVDQVDADRLPFTAGDLVTSPFYDTKEPPVFVLAGDGLVNGDVTLDFVKAKLESYGVEVVTDVDIHTTYLVALKDFEQAPEYGEAKKLGIPILRESDLLEFIGY